MTARSTSYDSSSSSSAACRLRSWAPGRWLQLVTSDFSLGKIEMRQPLQFPASCISWTIEQLQPAAGFWTLGQLVGQGVSCHTHSEKYYYMHAPSISNAPSTIKEFAETSLSTPIRELQSWEGLLWQKNNGRAKRVRASAAECNKWCSARPLQAQAPAAGHHQLLQEPHPPANVATIPTKWCSLESNTFQQRKWAAFRCALSNGCLLQS